MEHIEFMDRYSATRKPYPNPTTVCLGRCEGMACYPVQRRRPSDDVYVTEVNILDQGLWDVEHDLHCNLWGCIADLWNHRQVWYWKSVFRDVLRLLQGKGYCDGWHFVSCADCNGTGLRQEKI